MSRGQAASQHAPPTDLGGDLLNPIAGQIQNKEVVKCGDECRNPLEASSVDLPLLHILQLDKTVRQGLFGTEEGQIQAVLVLFRRRLPVGRLYLPVLLLDPQDEVSVF